MKEKNLISELIICSVRKRLGANYTVTRNDVSKNNGHVLTGLTIRKGVETAAPNIYIDDFISEHCAGMPLETVTDAIIQIYRHTPPQYFNAEAFLDFNWVKGRIIYQMVNTSLNRKLLEDIPSVPVLDLSLVFKVIIDATPDDGISTITIHNSHLDLWNVTKEKIYELAKENTPKLLPAKVSSLAELLCQYFTEDSDACQQEALDEEVLPLYVLTNSRRFHGSCCINYPGVLSGFAEKVKKDLYILPSSVHETLLLPDIGGDLDPSELRDMVFCVNQTEVRREEVLSDNVYLYSRETKKLTQI